MTETCVKRFLSGLNLTLYFSFWGLRPRLPQGLHPWTLHGGGNPQTPWFWYLKTAILGPWKSLKFCPFSLLWTLSLTVSINVGKILCLRSSSSSSFVSFLLSAVQKVGNPPFLGSFFWVIHVHSCPLSSVCVFDHNFTAQCTPLSASSVKTVVCSCSFHTEYSIRIQFCPNCRPNSVL